MYFYSCAKPSSVSYRSTRMVIGGGKSNATKDLLRSMLHAWYDLTKNEAGAWTAQLEWEVALQQQMNNPVSSCCWLVRGYISSSFKCVVAATVMHSRPTQTEFTSVFRTRVANTDFPMHASVHRSK